MTECRIDFETRSDVDLKKAGADVYFASAHFRALGASYRIGDGPMRDWEHGQTCPVDLAEHIRARRRIRAFNAAFERKCMRELARRAGWPEADIDQFWCTAAEAAAMSLPRSLDGAAQALGLEVQKDKEGMRLIRKFSMPRRARAGEDPAGVYWNEPEDHPEDYALFVKYRQQDVVVEEGVATRVVPLSDAEHAVYVMNERINDRGVRIDRTSARAALVIADKAKKLLDREMRLATGGYVAACSQPGKLVEWIGTQGVELGSAAKAEITDLLETDDLPVNVRRALELRQEAAKTSVSKLATMLTAANADGRVRGTSMYHAAGTGRFQSARVNFSNLPRPRKAYDDAHVRSDVLFKAFRQQDPELLHYLYDGDLGRPLHLISDAIRGFIWAAPGHDLVQADYSGIEGAVIAWLAGEDWKLDALFAIIADPSLPDLYRRTAASILNLSTDVVTKKHWARQSVGKVSELSLGFQGSVSAFYSMSRNYGVKLDPLYAPVWETASDEMQAKAIKRYESQLKRGLSQTTMLSREAWLACYIITQGWRQTNPMIAQSWHDSENAARQAIASPGSVFEAARSKYVVKLGFLWMQLPSGRVLAFGAPRLSDQVWAEIKLPDGSWSDAEVTLRYEAEKLELRGEARIKGNTSPKITILTTDPVTRTFRRRPTYGGDLMQSATQATARDLLVNGMLKAEAAGYPIIATVYDEIISEVPRGWGDVQAFEKLICELPPWAAGLPLSAGGWRGKRYRKD